METSASIDIDRPIGAVFDYTLNNVAEWSLTVVEDKVTSDGPIRVGTTFETVTDDCGRRMDFTGKVTAHEEPTLHSIELIGKSFDLIVDYKFESIDSGTRLTQSSVVKPKGFMKVMFFFMAWMMKGKGCDQVQKELESLKQHCEEKIAQDDSSH